MEKLFGCCYPKSAKQQDIKEDLNDFFVPHQGFNATSYMNQSSFNGAQMLSTPSKHILNKGVPNHHTDRSSKFFSQNMNDDKETNYGYFKGNAYKVESLNLGPTLLKSCNNLAQETKNCWDKPMTWVDSSKILNKKIEKGDTSIKSIITDIVVQENSRLELEELEGAMLDGQRIKINASGYEKSFRNRRDGCTYFGACNYSSQDKQNLIDVILKLDSELDDEYLFKICFDVLKKSYRLSSNMNEASKNIIFMRLTAPFSLMSKNIVSLGDIHVSLEVDPNKCLKIDVVGNKDEIIKIFSKDFEGPIRIGRCKKNEIFLNNSALSRIQTSIKFHSESQLWIIEDGLDGRKSTNGTWIYLDFDWEIAQDVSYFRLNKNFFVIRKIY